MIPKMNQPNLEWIIQKSSLIKPLLMMFQKLMYNLNLG
jgi:hypothetical protein